MIYTFNRKALLNDLAKISYWKCLCFGALILERSVTNFFLFQVESGSRGGAILRLAQAKIWSVIEECADFTGEISGDLCSAVAPDTEEWATPHTSSALDAVSIASNILDYIDNRNLQLIAEAAELMHDSTDMFVGNTLLSMRDDPDFNTRVNTHSIVQRELKAQSSDIAFLADLEENPKLSFPRVLKRIIDLEYSKSTLV